MLYNRFTLIATAAVIALSAPVHAKKCPPDSVEISGICVDTYEASAWAIPTNNPMGKSNQRLLTKLVNGKATAADLTAGNATQLGAAGTVACTGTEYPASFPPDGNWTASVYAASVSGVLPSACINWNQAMQACALAGKHLIRDDEWLAVAASTPTTADDAANTCHSSSTLPALPVNTGSRSSCVSAWGAHDLIGNIYEWTASGSDYPYYGYQTFRGGSWLTNSASVANYSYGGPSYVNYDLGFRCARPK
jgi:formylglycine-generating enzyme required for sulfatase activity